jgi:hypothetical protein
MLFLIDCQYEYSEVVEPILPAILSEIKTAKRRKNIICCCTYDYVEDLYNEIHFELFLYKKYLLFDKNKDNGTTFFLDNMSQAGYDPYRIRKIIVGGVNTSYCVKDTVRGLSKKLPNTKILIKKSIINCSYKNSFSWAKPLTNVILED